MSIPTPQKPRRIELATGVRHEEYAAGNGSIKPGMLLVQGSTGTVLPHATAGGFATRWFATEEALIGPPVQDSSVDLAYASGALVSIMTAKPNDRVNALLKAGVAYAVGDFLVSDGAGRLEKLTALASAGLGKQVIAQLDKYSGAVDLSATGAVDTRASVIIL